MLPKFGLLTFEFHHTLLSLIYTSEKATLSVLPVLIVKTSFCKGKAEEVPRIVDNLVVEYTNDQ